MRHLRHLNKYFFKYRYRLILGMLFVVASNVFGVLPPQVIRYAFDLVKDNITYYQQLDGFDLQGQFYGLFSSILLLFGLIVLSLAVIKGLFMFCMRQTIIVMSRLIEYDLRNEVYTHYQALSTAFYKRHRTGDMMSRITEDVSKVRMYLGPAIMYSINLTVLIFIVVLTMINVNPTLTFYALLPLPLLSISIYYVNTIINKRSEEIQEQLSGLTNVAQESFSGIRVLKAYAQERATNTHFDTESETYKERSLKLARVQALFYPLMLLLIGLSVILTIYVGGKQVIAGYITSGNIAEFVIYVNMLTWPVTSIGWVASIIQRAAASQKRINEFLGEAPDIVSGELSIDEMKGEIRFEDVTFVYPDTGIQALTDVNFHLKAGESMAIIGHTGSGKTTIADLLVRKYDPSEGNISIDGQVLDQLDLTDLRRQIGYVPQDVFLFSDTVHNNIRFGLTAESASLDSSVEEAKEMDARIQLAAQQAAIWNEINSLPEKTMTIVGERGVTLSGGQKQRISLARALIKDPAMLILDDCLSAVDASTEHEILSQLDKYMSGRTSIIITHRIFSLMNFDQIIILEEGRIVERGTHESLLKAKGRYFELYEQQRMEEQVV